MFCFETANPLYLRVWMTGPSLSEGLDPPLITKFRYIEVGFHICYYYWGKEDRLLYRGLRHIKVRYIEVLLYDATSV